MNEIVTQSTMIRLPAPKVELSIRQGTMEDLPFMDAMQKKTVAQVGFMPKAQLEGKIKLGHVLVAEAHERVGYCIGNDQYFKRDDVGIIYALNVLPGLQRKLVGATLIKAMFERAAYGCKLFCCWCAQDIAANYFWESIGFVPIAFRSGSRGKGPNGQPRVHIFWQKRIREGDTTTSYWFPCETKGGAIREDRLVLPIPPGTHWKDAKPILLPAGVLPAGVPETTNDLGQGSPCLPTPKRQDSPKQEKRPAEGRAAKATNSPVAIKHALGSVLRFAAPKPAKKIHEKKKERKPKQKNDPRYVAAARELRDRWMEAVTSGQLVIEAGGKYDVARMIQSNDTAPMPALPSPGLAA